MIVEMFAKWNGYATQNLLQISISVFYTLDSVTIFACFVWFYFIFNPFTEAENEWRKKWFSDISYEEHCSDVEARIHIKSLVSRNQWIQKENKRKADNQHDLGEE